MHAFGGLVSLALAFVLFGCAEMPPRPPLDGNIELVSQRDIREITAAAKAVVAPQPVYSVHIESAHLAYAYYGERRVHYDDREQAVVVRRVDGHWRATGEEIVSVANIPVG